MTTEVLAPLAIPESTEIKTGVYVIPSNKYARVKCLEAHDQDFTVNGVICEKARRFREIRQSGAAVTPAAITPPAGYTWDIDINVTARNSARIGLANTINSTSYTRIAFYSMISTGGTSNVFVQGTTSDPNHLSAHKRHLLQGGDPIKIHTQTYSYYLSGYLVKQGDNYEDVVPAGTALDGDRYSVSLYPIPIANLPLELQE